MSLAASLRAALARGGTAAAIACDIDDPVDPQAPPAIPAAVLVAVVEHAEPAVILTLRHESLRNHAGQIAFPGGRIDPGDAGAQAAALREAQEEIGLDPAAAEVVGLADDYRTITGFAVTPVIAVVPPGLPLAPREGEVAAIFEAPLAHLMAPAHHLRRTAMWRGRERHYYEISWGEWRIWGATAAMLVNLSRRLAA